MKGWSQTVYVPGIIIAIAALTGCQNGGAQAPPVPEGPAVTQPGTHPQASPSQAAPDGAVAQITHHDIAAEIDPGSHWLTARCRVDWVAEQPVSEVSFDFRGNLKMRGLTDSDGNALRYSRTDSGMTVALGRRAGAGDEFSFTIEYEGEINGPKGGARGQRLWDYIGSEGTYVRFEAAWYPQVFGDTATADIALTVPEGWTAVTSGDLVGETDNTFRWRISHPAAGLSFTAAPYEITEDSSGPVPVTCYTFPQHTDRAREFATLCSSILRMHSRLFGEYAFPRFSVAEIPDLYGGGHGDQGFIMLQERAFTGTLDEEFIAHEMAHNWWGSLVMCTESEFLIEGFATYSQALWREEASGAAGLIPAMRQMAQSVLLSSMGEGETSTYESDSGPLLYEKGAWILHMLRRVVGDEKWFATVRDFATENAGKVVTCRQFAQAFESVHGEKLDWFFDQWLYGVGVPWVRGVVTDPGGGKAKVTLTQHAVNDAETADKLKATDIWDTAPSRFKIPVDVLIKCGRKRVRETIWLDGPTAEAEIAVPGTPTSLVIDPNEWLLDHSKGLVGELDAEMQQLEKELEEELGDLGNVDLGDLNL